MCHAMEDDQCDGKIVIERNHLSAKVCEPKQLRSMPSKQKKDVSRGG